MVSGNDRLPQGEQLWVGHEFAPNGSEDDGGGELAVYPFAHYALKTHRGGHETEANERDGVVPGRVRAARSYASLTGLRDRDRGGHREERLDHRSCGFVVKRGELGRMDFQSAAKVES